MKITHAISDTNIGGAGILLASIAENLKNEFDFEIIIPKDSRLRERLPADIKITELDISGEKSISAKDILTFYKYFKKNPPDLLHTHACLSARIGGKLAKVPFTVSTRHCAKPDAAVKQHGFLSRMLYNFSTDLTVSTADFATKNLIKEGLSPSRIITIKNGSPDLGGRAFDSDFSVTEALGLPKDTKIIGSVARLEKVKGQDLILRAAPSIIKEFPNIHFLFLGDGSMKEEYLRTASNLGIEKYVSFLGYVKNPVLYQKDFFLNINASRGTETSCLATSECMSLGIPTVASSFGGNTEMIKNGVNGFIFDTDNIFTLSECILTVLRDERIHKRLSEGARESYEELFSSARMADKYRSLYLSSRSLYLSSRKRLTRA